jgi:Fe2+ or Zn2+ uptake regulation protein
VRRNTKNPETQQRIDDKVRTLLASAKLRHTRQRSEILGLLVEKSGPFSTQEIRSLIGRAACDPVTIYRVLENFEKARIVRRCDFSDGVGRYELAAGDKHHHHLVCTGCRRVEDLDITDCPTQKLERSARARGYAEVDHSLEIFGLCPRCQSVATSR